MTVVTYLDSDAEACDLECAPRPSLVYRCWNDKGPGFSEKLSFHYGPAVGGEVYALWLSSDWCPPESIQKYAVAWTADKKLPAEPWAVMLRAYWEAEKNENFLEEPNFSEIEATPRSSMRKRSTGGHRGLLALAA